MKEGAIDQLPSGRWRLRIRVSGKRETIGTYDTEPEAVRARDAHLEVLEQTAFDYEGVTVAKHADKVITRREVKKLVRDTGTERSRYEQYIAAAPLGSIALRSAQARHVFSWLEWLEDRRLQPSTRRNALSLLRIVMRDAHERGLIKHNPTIGVRVSGKDKDAWTYLTREELPRLLAACDPGLERHIVAVAIGTGLRPGELVTLRRSDVYLDERPRILVRFGAAPDVPTKTGAVRTVHLFGLSLMAMRSWAAAPLPWAKGRRKPPNPHDLVFPRERGGFRDEDHVLRWEEWKALLERAGMTRRFRWYDFRHTCASWLVSGWWGRRWSLQEVKEMLGHTSITITQRYAHLAASASEEAARLTVGDGSADLATPELAPGPGSRGVMGAGPPTTSETSRDVGNAEESTSAPPGRVELPANGLGKPRSSQSTAAISPRDPLVTRPPVSGSQAGGLGANPHNLRLLRMLRAAHASVYGGRPVFDDIDALGAM